MPNAAKELLSTFSQLSCITAEWIARLDGAESGFQSAIDWGAKYVVLCCGGSSCAQDWFSRSFRQFELAKCDIVGFYVIQVLLCLKKCLKK